MVMDCSRPVALSTSVAAYGETLAAPDALLVVDGDDTGAGALGLLPGRAIRRINFESDGNAAQSDVVFDKNGQLTGNTNPEGIVLGNYSYFDAVGGHCRSRYTKAPERRG